MTETLKDRMLSFDTAAPRYTSYPPATAFVPDFPEKTYGSWLESMPDSDPLSLYVHIPFCQKLCYYCGCFTTISAKKERIESYIDDLIGELSFLESHLQHPSLSHLHFGGGSPTMLRPASFSRLMEEIHRRFSFEKDAEIAIEADPRQMNEARIATFAKNGVNRISLGMQDVNQEVLTAVNRQQPFFLSWDAVNLCRSYGIEQINLDIMYGLPGQTVDTIRESLEIALTLKPNRIAFFGYAHVPWMKKHMRMMNGLSLPDPSLRYDLYEAGRAILIQAGYLPVGIDHFVRPSDSMAQALANRTLRRNFQGYTTDKSRSLIGIGASSIGSFPEGYIQNIADLKLYHEKIAAHSLPINKGYEFTEQDHIYGAIISEIMCYMAVDLDQIAQQKNVPSSYFNDAVLRLHQLVKSGLVSVEGSFVRIHHPHVARMAARCFDPMLSDSLLKQRHSHTV
jgi:oxygen-independent coproporphyrinogen III oxidase